MKSMVFVPYTYLSFCFSPTEFHLSQQLCSLFHHQCSLIGVCWYITTRLWTSRRQKWNEIHNVFIFRVCSCFVVYVLAINTQVAPYFESCIIIATGGHAQLTTATNHTFSPFLSTVYRMFLISCDFLSYMFRIISISWQIHTFDNTGTVVNCNSLIPIAVSQFVACTARGSRWALHTGPNSALPALHHLNMKIHNNNALGNRISCLHANLLHA